MHIDRDGEWISEGLRHGTILIAHDWFFMQEQSLDICPAAVIITVLPVTNWQKYLWQNIQIVPTISVASSRVL